MGGEGGDLSSVKSTKNTVSLLKVGKARTLGLQKKAQRYRASFTKDADGDKGWAKRKMPAGEAVKSAVASKRNLSGGIAVKFKRSKSGVIRNGPKRENKADDRKITVKADGVITKSPSASEVKKSVKKIPKTTTKTPTKTPKKDDGKNAYKVPNIKGGHEEVRARRKRRHLPVRLRSGVCML